MSPAEKKIPFGALKPLYERHREEYDEAALRVLRSGWYIMGKETEAFEREFAQYVGVAHCVGVNSGLDALTIALRGLGIGTGDEVIVQGNTFIATVLAITAAGATPVFVEPDEFHGIDPESVRQAITPRTRAILAVHLYGQSCDMEPLCAIAAGAGLPIVEDCAQSHGGTYHGRMTGTFGRVSCYSFYPTKNLGGFGDGGAIVTDDTILAERLCLLRNYGSARRYHHEIEGVNSRLDEIQSALLRVRLAHIEEIITEREALARTYLEGIDNPLVELPKIRHGVRHVWHQFVVRCERRDELQSFLEGKNIGTLIHYPVPPHLSEAYRHLGYERGAFPKTELLADAILSLPFYNGIPGEDLDVVIDAVNAFR